MKRRMMYIAAIVTIALLAWLVGAGTTSAGGDPNPGRYHIRFVGQGATANWTTCPSGPMPQEVCTETYISVAEEMYGEDGTPFPSPTLTLSEYRYTVDDQGDWIYVSDTYGYGPASLTIDKKLTRASASATVPVTTCTFDEDGNETCQDRRATVSASWTGVCDLTRSHGSYTYRTSPKGSKYTYHWRGTNRNAMASGQVNDVDLGASYYSGLWDSKSVDIYIERGG